MKLPYMTTSIRADGGRRSPISIFVVYMAFLIGTSEVYCYQGALNTCGQEDGCMYDAEIGMLDCKNCDMQVIPLQVCPEVTYLDMRYNNLAKLSTPIRDYFRNLKILDLAGSQVNAISPKVFDRCDSLNTIYLDSNKITSLKRGSFDNLISLEYLYLSGNKINKIHTMIFDPLNKTLLYLDLSHNEIDRIEQGSFQQLRILRRLYLQNNNLRHINTGMLRGLQRLTHLYLSNNNIEHVPQNTFQDMPDLKELKLGNNPELFSIQSGALDHLTKLSFLDIMRTKIPTLRNVSHLFSSDYQLKTFHISETPLACDESFALWKEWYKGPENSSRKKATCRMPETLDTVQTSSMKPFQNNVTVPPILSSPKPFYNNFQENGSNNARQNRMQFATITAMIFISLSILQLLR